MKNRKYNKPKTLNIRGRNIFVDELGSTVYYDILTKIGYVIEENNKRTFYIFQNRVIIVLLGMILCADYILDLKYTIALGLILCIVFELVFRFWYLPKLKMLDDFIPQKKASLLSGIIDENNPKKTILKAVLYATFSVLVFINAVSQKMGLQMIILSSVLSVITAYYSILHIIGFTKMGKRT